MEYKETDIDELILNKKNPRINDAAAKKLIKGIEKYGFVNPVIVNQKTNIVLAGHTRIKAMKKLGRTTVPVVYVDMDEATAKGFAIWDNKSAEFSSWDDELLIEAVKELNEMNFDVELTGFSMDELIISDKPEKVIGEKKEKEPQLVLRFENPDDFKKVEEDIREVLENKKINASVSCGEV